MECGIIHNHHMIVIQFWAQLLIKPRIEDGSVGGAIEQHRCIEVSADASGDQTGARSAIARAHAIYFLPFGCPAIITFGGRRKPTFINVHEGFSRSMVFVMPSEIPFPNFSIILNLRILPRFFYASHSDASAHNESCCNAPYDVSPTRAE